MDQPPTEEQWQRIVDYYKQHNELQTGFAAEGREFLQNYSRFVHSYAVEGLKVVTLLPSGGLIAIPTVLALVGGSVQADKDAVLKAVFIFGIALLLAVSAWFLSYLSVSFGAVASSRMIAIGRTDASLATCREGQRYNDLTAQRSRLDEERKRFARFEWYSALVAVGVTMAVVCLFIWGTKVGLDWFDQKTTSSLSGQIVPWPALWFQK